MISRLLYTLPLAFFCALTARAADPQTFLTPAEAGPDYAVQGDYQGDKCGAQVIALGNNKFRVVGWSNGLPGVAADAEKTVEVEGTREGDKIPFKIKGWHGELLPGGQLVGSSDEGETFKLTRIVRESPTAGAKPPAGAIVLFDGTNADAFDHGKLDDRNLLWSGPKTKQKFQDFTLHVEFILPFKPLARGQERGNSGVYLQDRYEVQVLDSYGLKGEFNECGGIYRQTAPKINMCLPALQWQTYDIDFTAAKFDSAGKKTKNAVATIKHNGVTIHENQEITGSTGGGQPESPEPGAIQLQGHGNPVFYRNIWIVEKK
ncbi:MAG: hypothetical protein JWL59_2623 [Chthoniobacteraceae bacterium]|nr:hypothetical protein [Chthoniobacteraceae bacterium]